MNQERMEIAEVVGASLIRGATLNDILSMQGYYYAECFDKDGNLKWAAPIENVVTDVGVKLALDTILGNTAAGAVVMGLKGTGTAVVGDTQASHAGWLEVGGANAPAYSGTRKTPTFSAASGAGAGSRTKTTSAAVAFTFTSGGTVAGCFLNIAGTSAQDNTTGTLFSAGDFSGGSKTVASTDVLNVTYTLTA